MSTTGYPLVGERLLALAESLEKAEAREQVWKDRFKAIVGDDSPDGAGNAVLRLQHRADNLHAQLGYVVSEIGRATGVSISKPDAVEHVRVLVSIEAHQREKARVLADRVRRLEAVIVGMRAWLSTFPGESAWAMAIRMAALAKLDKLEGAK